MSVFTGSVHLSICFFYLDSVLKSLCNTSISEVVRSSQHWRAASVSEALRGAENSPTGHQNENHTNRCGFFVLCPLSNRLRKSIYAFAGVRILRVRRWELAHVSHEQKYSPKAKFPTDK